MTVIAKKRGRPPRAEASAKALARLLVDPATIDPRAILAAIAADLSAPASARVAACRALLTTKGGDDAEDAAEDAVLAKRALALLAAGRPN